MTRKRSKKPLTDVALLSGPTEDGRGARMLRYKEGALYAGEIRPAREGQALGGQELVRLEPLHEELPLCRVEVLHGGDGDGKASATEAAGAGRPEGHPAAGNQGRKQGSGPARIATDSYRKNWAAVFGGARKKRTDYSVN
ncbi:MAG: hypothetical protein OEZ06_00170 [Myxococcales bacterium]|nr:hypothetical protein [Myxococcales bacterium]